MSVPVLLVFSSLASGSGVLARAVSGGVGALLRVPKIGLEVIKMAHLRPKLRSPLTLRFLLVPEFLLETIHFGGVEALWVSSIYLL